MTDEILKLLQIVNSLGGVVAVAIAFYVKKMVVESESRIMQNLRNELEEFMNRKEMSVWEKRLADQHAFLQRQLEDLQHGLDFIRSHQK